jgi:hypothetical protein
MTNNGTYDYIQPSTLESLLIALHVLILMGHLQVFWDTHYLLLNYKARFIHVCTLLGDINLCGATVLA